MANAGILMHIRHLETIGWEKLVWGVPEEDSLGSLPKVAELLLNESSHEPISTIIFGCGPSIKDGLTEGEYTKKFLIDNLHQLAEFPRLRPLLTANTLERLRNRLETIVVTQELARSIDEVIEAAKIFAGKDVTKVYQVTSASHAPRCIQIQSTARLKGLIPTYQQWFVVADDRCFEGTEPFSTLIMEPPHRGDDPMLGFKPSLTEVMRAYQYGLTAENKKKLAVLVDEFMSKHAAHSDVRNLK